MSEVISQDLPYETIAVDDEIELRQLSAKDSGELFELVNNNRNHLGQWLPWVQYTETSEDSRKFISETIAKRAAGSEYGYGIVVDGNIAGHMSLMHLNDDKDPEIGYWISSDFAGRGITSKAAGSLTNFGLKTLGLNKIIIKADPANIASNRVAEKLGYKLQSQIESSDAPSGVSNVWLVERS